MIRGGPGSDKGVQGVMRVVKRRNEGVTWSDEGVLGVMSGSWE